MMQHGEQRMQILPSMVLVSEGVQTLKENKRQMVGLELIATHVIDGLLTQTIHGMHEALYRPLLNNSDTT